MMTTIYQPFRKKAVWGVLALAAAAGTGAVASTPDAWDQLDAQIRQSCTKASGLKQAKPAGEVVHFPDGKSSVSVLLVEGRHPAPHMRNARSKSLCMFNRADQTVVMSEANYLTKLRPAVKSAPKKK